MRKGWKDQVVTDERDVEKKTRSSTSPLVCIACLVLSIMKPLGRSQGEAGCGFLYHLICKLKERWSRSRGSDGMAHLRLCQKFRPVLIQYRVEGIGKC